MKAGDRALVTIKGESHFCNVIASDNKAVLILVNEDGEEVASIQEFWRKTEPMLGQESKHVETIGAKSSAYVKRVCCAKGCGVIYDAKKSDIARGWGLCCSKSCASAYRSQK